MTPEERLAQLRITLPEPPSPVASYVPAVTAGGLVFVAGQGPLVDGKPLYQGKVGGELSEEEGYQAARIAGLNVLAVLRSHLGTLNRVRRVVKVTAWVNSAPEFDRQPFVANGASDLFLQVFGESGRHARSAVGTNVLPFHIPVEVEAIVAIDFEDRGP